jgi:hypothetical protein
MKLFLISIKGKLNILVKNSQSAKFYFLSNNRILRNSMARIQNPFLFMKLSPFSPLTKC